VVLLLPWSIFLPVAVARLRFWRPQIWRGPAGPGDLPLLALIWLLLIVAFFSAAATKLPGYILPALPGGALLVGLLFAPFPVAAGQSELVPGPGLRWSGAINALLLAAAALAAALAPGWIGGDPSFPRFAEVIRASPLPLLLALPLALAAVALTVALLRSKGQPGALAWLWLPNAAAFAAVLALVVPALTPLLDQERLLPIRTLARLAGREAKQGEPLLVVGYKRYSVVYYSGRPVLFVSSPDEALKALSDREAGRRSHAGSGSSVLLLGSDPELLEFGVGPGDSALLARRDAHRLVRLPMDRLHQLVGP
jgi:4-amino-4-deoxy-L-arabinose transferase-like glycosyltransferase